MVNLISIGRRFSPLFKRSVFIGRLALKLSIWHKHLGLRLGYMSQRAVEYPWVLKTLRSFIPQGSRVLDVGCAESVLTHELIAYGYDVWCVDINVPMFAPKCAKFVRTDIRKTSFPDNFFDAIVVVSTIEHVGMPVYGQKIIEEDGDIKAMREIRRICKPGGFVIMTVPFHGKKLLLTAGERQYDFHRLRLLMEGFKPLIVHFYAPKRIKRSIIWEQIPFEKAICTTFEEPGLACLLLQKTKHKGNA